MNRRKSIDSLISQPNDTEIQTFSQRRSLESPTIGIQRRKSSENLMEIDDDFDSFDNNNQESVATRVNTTSYRPLQPLIKKSVSMTYLTKEDFEYSIKLLDSKINAVYKLCKYLGEKQNENSKALKRLVALDELSEEFWNVSSLTYLAVLT